MRPDTKRDVVVGRLSHELVVVVAREQRRHMLRNQFEHRSRQRRISIITRCIGIEIVGT